MARKELVMAEHPYWQTVLLEGGFMPKVVEIEETTKREIDGRTARKEISLYDAMMAEICGEHDAEKAKVRNRRRADRKHKMTPKMRKEQEWMRNMNICNRHIGWGWELIDDARIAEQERVNRADWETDLRDLEWDISYAEMEISSYEEDIDDFEMEIQHIEYALSDVENLKDRLKTLEELVEKAKQYMGNSQRFLQKYNYIKEMM